MKLLDTDKYQIVFSYMTNIIYKHTHTCVSVNKEMIGNKKNMFQRLGKESGWGGQKWGRWVKEGMENFQSMLFPRRNSLKWV